MPRLGRARPSRCHGTVERSSDRTCGFRARPSANTSSCSPLANTQCRLVAIPGSDQRTRVVVAIRLEGFQAAKRGHE
eukprot:scaffold317540_cov37-Tisochrysis_lutea.AAC.2